MSQTVDQALAAATFYSDGVDYHLIKLPASGITTAAGIVAEIGEPFAALIADKDEVTLLIPAEGVEEFAARLHNHAVSAITYRLITLDVELEPQLTGLIARISAALAAAGISILPYAAYTRDHLLVPADRFDDALTALRQLQSTG
jgi:hypothetical protein